MIPHHWMQSPSRCCCCHCCCCQILSGKMMLLSVLPPVTVDPGSPEVSPFQESTLWASVVGVNDTGAPAPGPSLGVLLAPAGCLGGLFRLMSLSQPSLQTGDAFFPSPQLCGVVWAGPNDAACWPGTCSSPSTADWAEPQCGVSSPTSCRRIVRRCRRSSLFDHSHIPSSFFFLV